MYYHGSDVEGISVLRPALSEHGKDLLYFSRKRENTLVYLVNAVKKCCRENGFEYEGKYKSWGPYGFDKDGLMRIEEYYPNALKDTYQGMRGYIYSAEESFENCFETGIRDVICIDHPVEVSQCEVITDVYQEILKAESKGLLRILRYDQMSDRMKAYSDKMIREEYLNSTEHPDYRFFIEKKFNVGCM